MTENTVEKDVEVSFNIKDLLDQINSKIDRIGDKLDAAIKTHEERIDTIEHRVSVHSGIFKAFGMIIGALSALFVWLHR